MSRNYRWGILGAGRIADKFCTALHYTTGASVYAVASRDKANAKAYADRYNAPRYYDRYEDLMTDSEVDVIYIATPHAFHYEHTMACLQHKKAVVCEKPMSLSYRQTSEMTRLATANKVFLMEGMWTACMPFIQQVRAIIDAGTIGQPQYVSADFGFTAPIDPESRLFNKSLGGGSLMDVGVYPLFLATYILGEPSQVKAVSKLSVTGVDEYTHMLLQYPGGETAHLLSSISFNTSIAAEIIGTEGRIQIHNPWFKATSFTVHLNDGTNTDHHFPHASNGFEHEIMEVMDCLDKGLLQSNKVPHRLSLQVSQLVETVLAQSGVAYDTN